MSVCSSISVLLKLAMIFSLFFLYWSNLCNDQFLAAPHQQTSITNNIWCLQLHKNTETKLCKQHIKLRWNMILNQHQKINQIATKYSSNPWFALQPSYSISDLVARQLRGALVLILESKIFLPNIGSSNCAGQFKCSFVGSCL